MALLLACALQACGEGAAPPEGAASEAARAASPPPAFEALPDCNEMSSLLGGLVDGLIPVTDDSGAQGKHRDGALYGVGCNWLTPPMPSERPFEVVRGGTLAVGITVGGTTQDEAALRRMELVYDDPRAAAIGGYVVMGKPLDLNAPLGVPGPLLIVGETTISVAGSGVYLQPSGELAPITLDRAIAVSVGLYRALQLR